MTRKVDDTAFSFRKLLLEWLAGGLANAFTSGILNPLDVAKTRIQTSKTSSSTFRMIQHTYISKGAIGLWGPGLTASMLREMLSSGPRAGFYVPVRREIAYLFDDEPNNSSLKTKALSAIITGTLGSIIANPSDVIKIRLMNDPEKYSSLREAFVDLYRSEGSSGLLKGIVPSTFRGAFIAVGELATYDHSKATLKESFGLQEGMVLHTIASLITGLVATTVAAPFDIIKTRTMNACLPVKPWKVLQEIVVVEGPFALLKGWLPSYLRLGPHALICFPLFEQLRHLLGLDFL